MIESIVMYLWMKRTKRVRENARKIFEMGASRDRKTPGYRVREIAREIG
jgi:hypothetical protein